MIDTIYYYLLFILIWGILLFHSFKKLKVIGILLIFSSTIITTFYTYLVFNPLYFTDKFWSAWHCNLKETGEKELQLELFCNAPEEINGNTPPTPLKKKYRKLNSDTKIIVLGDSFIWNSGVPSELSTTTILENLEKKQVYNQGRPGGTTSNAWNFLIDADKEVKNLRIEKIIYIYRDHHNTRNVGRGRWFFHPVNPRTFYQNGKITLEKNFSKHNNLSKFQNIAKLRAFFDYYKIGIENENSKDEDLQQTADIINEMSRLAKDVYRAKFYLVFYPEFRKDRIERRRKLVPLLSSFIKQIQPNVKITEQQKNPHPNAEGARQLADILYQSTN